MQRRIRRCLATVQLVLDSKFLSQINQKLSSPQPQSLKQLISK